MHYGMRLPYVERTRRPKCVRVGGWFYAAKRCSRAGRHFSQA